MSSPGAKSGIQWNSVIIKLPTLWDAATSEGMPRASVSTLKPLNVMEHATQKPKKRAGKVIHSAVSQHALAKAAEIRERYGPIIDYPTVLAILDDRKSTRYPVQIKFTTDGIESGMFAKTDPVSENPDDGYVISLHANLEGQLEALPALILYQSVLVNYGDLATADDAELFGSGVLGMDREDYYEMVMALTDALWGR